MKWRNCLLALVLSIFTCSDAVAETMPALNDFAYGMEIEIGGDGPLYQLVMPLDVYRGVARSDLGDLCVFNGEEEIVPYMIRRTAAQKSQQHEVVPLPIFPLYGQPEKTLEGLSLKMRKDSTGAIIDVNTGDGKGTEREVVAYLMDASSLRLPLTALDLEWETGPEGFVQRISIEGSDDLDRWSLLVKDATIASLRYGDHSLVQRRIELGGVRSKYLRLSWPQMHEAARIVGVQAELRKAAVEQPRQWITLTAEQEHVRPGEYFFDSLGYMPVDRVRIKLPQKNTLVHASVFSRAEQSGSWRLRYSGLVYDLRFDGKDLVNADMILSSEHERYWMVRVDQSGGGLGQRTPQLELGWVPQELVFVARGSNPFRLAYGSAHIDGRSLQALDFLSGFAHQHRGELLIRTVQPGPRMVLGGDSRLRPLPSKASWKRWILWSVLALGVAFLAWMASRLYRQMNRSA